MIDINNKGFRKGLIDKYLNAETSIFEERLLVDYYLGNSIIDEDERAIAETIRMENMHAYLLSNAGVEEFDKLVNGAKRNPKNLSIRLIAFASGIAASVALFFAIYPFAPKNANTVDIAQCIRQVMDLEIDNIASVTATPVNEYVWISAEFNNGATKTFIMSNDVEMESTSLLAIN